MITEQMEGYRLSPQQERLWSLRRAGADTPYRALCSVIISGPLDARALKAAAEEVAGRHEIFRTEFRLDASSGAARQVVLDQHSLAIVEHDLSGLGEDERESALAALALDAEREPCAALRGALVRLAQDSHLLRLEAPVIYSDGPTLAAFVAELSRAYAAGAAGRADGEHLQYADVAAWQNEILEAPEGGIGRQHWRGSFDTSLLELKLPAEAGGSRAQDFEPRVLVRTLGLSARLEGLAEACGASPFVLLLACWHLLIQRLTGRTDSVVGAVYDGRRYEELRRTLGPLSKHLPIYVRGGEGQTLCDLLAQVKGAADLASRWQEYFTWDAIDPQGAINLEAPFLPFCFEYREEQALPPAGDTTFAILEQHAHVDRFKVKLCCCSGPDGASRVELFYDGALFRAADADLLADQFCGLLESVAALPPGAPLDDLTVLAESERRKLLKWNETSAECERGACIHELFERRAEESPGAVAVVCGGQRLTYGELNVRSDRLAAHLRELGVGPEVLVGLLTGRSIGMVVGLLAVLKAGGGYVPLDPEYPADRLLFMAEDSGIAVLLTEERALPLLPRGMSARVVCVDAVPGEAEGGAGVDHRSGLSADNLAYIIYTSGSTGAPKGVQVTHSNLVNYIAGAGERFEVGPGDTVLQFASVSFDASAEEIYLALTRGATLALRTEEMMNSVPDFLRRCGELGVTVLDLPTAYWHELCAQLDGEALRLPGSIRLVIIGGEKARPDRLAAWRRKVGARVRLVNTYGPTEATVVATCEDHLEASDSAYADQTEIPIGKPVGNVKAHVLDKFIRLAPVGVVGELYIGGAGVSRGYLNRPELTAERFVPDPFSLEPGARLYRTGDLVKWLPGGELEFVGRADHQVKVRGHRIELGEVESRLRSHPSVSEAVVTVREDGGDKRLACYYVRGDGAGVTSSQLREHLREALPEYMLPSSFTLLDALPLTPNGKVDRKALPEPDSRACPSDAYAEPRTEAERVLACVWGELLGAERVGIHDNFFELGGDSILSIQVVARANKAGVRLTARQIFEYQTIARLTGEGGVFYGSEQGSASGPVALTPLQKRFFEAHPAEPGRWSQEVLVEVRRGLEPGLLGKALGHLAGRHDALRSRFVNAGDGVEQLIEDRLTELPLALADLSACGEAEASARLRAAAETLHAGLGLAGGPLVGAAYFDRGEGNIAHLLLAVHRLLTDRVSWAILLEDLEMICEQLGRGEEPRLPARTASYKEFVGRLTARAVDLSHEAPYWTDGARRRVRPLPVDSRGGRNTADSAREVCAELTAAETETLLREVPKLFRAEADDALLTAVLLAVTDWAGGKDLLIELEDDGRRALAYEADFSRTVGCFDTAYPVLLERGESGAPADLLKTVKEQLRRVPGHGLGHGLLRYSRGDERLAEELRSLPEAEVKFTRRLENPAGAARRDALFGPAKLPARVSRYGRAVRQHLLEVGAVVEEGRLRMTWTYSENMHSAETARGLAEAAVESLRSIIRACGEGRAAGYTPSDFPLLKLDQRQLDKLLSNISGAPGRTTQGRS